MSKSISERVIEIIADKSGLDPKVIVPSANITTDLSIDSLDKVELVMELEKEFNISMTDDEMEKIMTVGDVITYIESYAEKTITK